MSTKMHAVVRTLALSLVLSTLPLAASTGPWMAADKTPLPFAHDDEVLDFLATAEVTASKTLSQGINKCRKLTLQRGDVTAHAVFRTVQVEHKRTRSNSLPSRDTFRDSYVFEKAAYELSRLLGLDRVPPTVVRTFDGQEGTLQLWIESASTEASLIETGKAGNAGIRHLQKQVMLVFDNLIYNFDRHQNNILYGPDRKLWFIDHTRAFRGRPELPTRTRLTMVDSRLLQTLREVDERAMRDVLKPYLNHVEADAVVRRKRLLVKRFETLLAERGNGGVIYDLEEITLATRKAERERLIRVAGEAAADLEPAKAGSSG